MSEKFTKSLLIFSDFLSALFAWSIFFYFRKIYVEEAVFEVSERFFWGILILPLFWLGLYFVQGTYLSIKRLYLMRILSLTIMGTAIGTLFIFFLLLLDDKVNNYSSYYTLFFGLFVLHFFITLIPRLFITYSIVHKIHQKKWGFKTLLIGGSQKAVSVYREIEELPKGIGTDFVGFVNINGIDTDLKEELEHLGHADQLEEVVDDQEIEEVIIALDSSEHERLKQLVSRIQGRHIRIKIIPDMFDLLSGSIKMNNIFGAMLVAVDDEIMPFWQFVFKRIIDIVFSVFALVILSPLYIVLAILVKRSSPGPVFFKQERIGKNGVPFQIVKFRTMYMNAEKDGPQLSSANDPRITPIGRYMRKLRLDELPQFWNVLVGEMSLVGPRPERQFYINKIAKVEPQFLQLTIVKPGITSWGQVKFGYAENVEEMIKRMKFDLLYIKNMSLALDFKILLYTVIIIFKASGK